jgi:hypothetical protein
MRPRKLYLTFDVEDFINHSSVLGLRIILELMEKAELKGLFFLTGHMAEKLIHHKDILQMLSVHQIGYHSTSHSVRPAIFEYTDIQDYEQAMAISQMMETSHVNPLTGETKGTGGITLIKTLFPDNEITAFRAPGFCWSPPHLEALQRLGISFDFSSDFSRKPVHYRGTTFYPYPFLIISPDGEDFGVRTSLKLSRLVLARPTSTILIHPQSLFNRTFWDSQFWASNPDRLSEAVTKNPREIKYLIQRLYTFFKALNVLQKTGSIEVTPNLQVTGQILRPSMYLAKMSYKRAVYWPIRRFKYRPRYLYAHFLHFLGL